MIKTPRKVDDHLEVLRYFPLMYISNPADMDKMPEPDAISIRDLLDQVFSNLSIASKNNQAILEIPDAEYFVGRLVKAVDILKPAVKNALISEISFTPGFGEELIARALPQGIPAD